MPVPASIKCPQVTDHPHTCGGRATVEEIAPGSYRSTCTRTPAPGSNPHVQVFGDAFLRIAEPA